MTAPWVPRMEAEREYGRVLLGMHAWHRPGGSSRRARGQGRGRHVDMFRRPYYAGRYRSAGERTHEAFDPYPRAPRQGDRHAIAHFVRAGRRGVTRTQMHEASVCICVSNSSDPVGAVRDVGKPGTIGLHSGERRPRGAGRRSDAACHGGGGGHRAATRSRLTTSPRPPQRRGQHLNGSVVGSQALFGRGLARIAHFWYINDALDRLRAQPDGGSRA
jgi:hypothetical protein